MSLRKVEARLVASDETGDVRSVEVFGHELTEAFSEVEDTDEVISKLAANPHIEVKGEGVVNYAAPAADPFDHDGDGKPGGSKPRGRRAAASEEA